MKTETGHKQSLYQCAGECLERATRVIDQLAAWHGADGADMTFMERELHCIRDLTAGMGFDEAAALARQMDERFCAAAANKSISAVRNLVSRSCEHLRRHSLAVLAGQTPPQIRKLADIEKECHDPAPYDVGNDLDDASHALEVEGPEIGDSSEAQTRRNMRFPADIPKVQLVVKFEAEVRDESFGGIRVKVPQDLRLRPRQVLDVQYKGAPMEAVVIWTASDRDGDCDVGLQWK